MSFLQILTAFLVAHSALAADTPSLDEAIRKARAEGKSVTAVSPVYSQLVRFAIPEGFQGTFENTKGDFYILEMVPKGENAQVWTQMVTLTGHQNLTANPGATPQKLAAGIAGGFKQACPESFAALGLGSLQTEGAEPHEAYVGLASCGTVHGHGPDHSESVMVVAIKGSQDYYTLQWAERGPPGAQPTDLQDPKWPARLAKMRPIMICPKVAGEPAPYPSCADQK